MFITRKALSRRTVLRGLGASVALPLLDGMVPAMTPLAKTAARPVTRLAVLYAGMGAAVGYWTPATEGSDFALTPILEPLAPFRERLRVLTGLCNKPAEPLKGEPGGGHGRITPAFLTGVHARPTEGPDLQAGVSIDQIVARHVGDSTVRRSLELCLEPPAPGGDCDVGFSCAYLNTVSWQTPHTPLPMEHHPRVVFDDLFGDPDSSAPAARLSRMRKDRSLLDSVVEKAASLARRLGPRDRLKLSEYLEGIRDIERRIQRVEAQDARQRPLAHRPLGVPETFEDHAKLMIDLQVLAFQSDVTRVITFMLTKELSHRTYPEIGVPDPHHPLSHHGRRPDALRRLARVNAHHVEMLAYYVARLQTTDDGSGSLLDRTLLLYGSGMGDGNKHDPHDLPILLLGGKVYISGGRHVRYPKETPLANLYLTMLNMLDVPADRFGDSTGLLAHLTGT